MITDRFGRHEVVLLINHNHNKICDVLSFFKIKINDIPRFFAGGEKKNDSSVRVLKRTVQLLWHDAYFLLHCPINAAIRTTADSQSVLRILL